MFPPEERGVKGDAKTDDKDRIALPRLMDETDEKAMDKSAKRRLNILKTMRAAMEAGEMSRTPEDLKTEDRGVRRSGVLVDSVGMKKESAKSVKPPIQEDGDDFFDDDDESE